MDVNDSAKENSEEKSSDGDAVFVQCVLRGGRPWGFTVEGGSEVNTSLTIARVSRYTRYKAVVQLEQHYQQIIEIGLVSPNNTEYGFT